MDSKQTEIALKLLGDYQSNPIVVNQGEVRKFDEFDKSRLEVIAKINPMLNQFFEGSLPLEKLKYELDSINKLNPLWGFMGINGQMFFNMLSNSAKSKETLTKLLKQVLKCPENINSAKDKINALIEFIKTDTSPKDKRSTPRTKSSLYFLSYFWQIQAPERYPIFYNSLEQTLTELDFLQYNDNLADYYETFYNISFELQKLFIVDGVKANLWYVEHVFWKYYIENKDIPQIAEVQTKEKRKVVVRELEAQSDETSMIPIYLKDYLKTSIMEKTPAEFEKKTSALFTAIGFETILKGQGKGRVVDLIARANTSKPYVILTDCKARSGKDFKFGSNDERAVQEYISNFLTEYPRDKQLEIHYLIVSSGFRDDNAESIRRIKGLTNIDVSLIDAETLIFLLDKKLQYWNIDLNRIRELFLLDRQITKDIIQDMVVGR